jgi:hypothetical protein
MTKKKKILIIGNARHGKDTVAEIIKKQFGLNFESSSVAAARIFIYDALKNKYGYTSPEECFEDRVNRRDEWYQLICGYNEVDKARLAKMILEKDDMYVGMRDDAEIQACIDQGIFDLIIGVYDPRKPLEPATSFNIDLWAVSDIVIPNAEGLLELNYRVKALEPLLKAA